MALASSYDAYQYLTLAYIKVDVYSSTLSSFSSRLLSSTPLRSTVSIMSPEAEQPWLGSAGGCPDPAQPWPGCQHLSIWSPAPLEWPQGVYHLWLTHPSFPLCAMSAILCICRVFKSRVTQSQLLWHLKKRERKSKLFQLFLCNLFSFRKEGNMQWQVWLWMFLGRVNLWV